MKYIIFKSITTNVENHYQMIEILEASSLEIASDLVFMKFRRTVNKENGESYLIVPYISEMKLRRNKTPNLDGIPFCVVQYREVREEI